MDRQRIPRILWLGEPDCHRRELVGGKAAHLSRLASSYPVPPGFCLAADASRARQESLPADALLKNVEAAYRALADRCNTHMPSVAVRSSAIDEDGTVTSLAGQYESYLNIVGVTGLLQAIRRCWDSAHSERVRAYRRQRGLSEHAPLAILIQQLVLADVSAVVFSADPVTHDASRVVINASWGLGESIVGGTVTPDTYTVGKPGLALTSSIIADKQRMTVRAQAGTHEVDVPRFLRTRPALSEEQVLEMARLALSLEEEMGWPVDVECAYQASDLFLLQCRPITALVADP